jgi:hypothetical protein
MFIKKLLLISLVLLMGSGCSNRLYDWDGYNDHLYNYYKDPATADRFLERMETHLQKVEEKGGTPPPGLYAEVGTLYLQKGDQPQAIFFYQKEHDAWKESQYFMAALIKNLSQRTEGKE